MRCVKDGRVYDVMFLTVLCYVIALQVLCDRNDHPYRSLKGIQDAPTQLVYEPLIKSRLNCMRGPML